MSARLVLGGKEQQHARTQPRSTLVLKHDQGEMKKKWNHLGKERRASLTGSEIKKRLA